MTSQRFCLRWNNHQSNLLSVFDQLLQDESFVDVTLAVDGRNLKAHKIVLSACSPYFQALFVGHPDRHPIVILKDIPYVDMRSLLDFMYRGEVSVDQDRLTMFLKVAESLRIKGLTEASGNNCDNLAKMGSTLTGGHPSTGAMSMYQQRLKRPLSASQHSLNSLSNNPLLGSALAGPKRKRGLPRKLSGSLSSGLDMMPDMEEAEGRDEEAFDDDRSVQSDSDMIERAHSPFDNKMLEVNVSEVKAPRQRPPSSTGPDDPSNVDERGEERRSPSPEREDEGEREGGKQTPQDLAANIKMERDADAPSGGDQNERNSSPVPERFPPGLLRLIPRSELVSKEKLDSVGLLKVNGQNGRTSQAQANLNLLKSLIMNNNVEENGDENGRAQLLAQFSSEHKFILNQLEQFQKSANANAKEFFNNNFSLHAQSQHIHQMLTNNNNVNNDSENHNFVAPDNGNLSPTAVKRRIRRRATSSSDPTESLTEMSVRGLDLFRYASVTEGIYKCMECAKVDVIKTFKNKYSFQRHAFLYHEGCQRKVFPCPVCGKEFSRPDKMKNHMKTVHDCFMPATSPQGSRNSRSSPLVLDFTKDFDKNLVHNLSIFATNKSGVGVPTGNGPSTAALPLVPFYLPP